MDILHGTGHDTLPHVRHVAWDRPFHWIEQGIVDLAHTPTTSLIMGLVFCVIGYLMFALAQQRLSLTHVYMASIGGAPMGSVPGWSQEVGESVFAATKTSAR